MVEKMSLLEYLYELKYNYSGNDPKSEIEKHIQYRTVCNPDLGLRHTIHGINWDLNPNSRVQETLDSSQPTPSIKEIFEEAGIEIKYDDQPICFEAPNEKDVSSNFYLPEILTTILLKSTVDNCLR